MGNQNGNGEKVMTPKPKPEKKPKKTRTKSICVECGTIWRGNDEVHEPGCRNKIKVITFRKNKTEKQMYEAALDHICGILTNWRDGGVMCVIHDYDCGQYRNWGHVIPQGANAWLIYELSNSFSQSNTCNLLHRSVQDPYYRWYKETFGITAYNMLIDAWKTKKSGRNAHELFELLIEYVRLWNYRFYAETIADKVATGYYGKIIKEAWIKDGKI